MYNVVLVNLSSDARANGLIAGISSEASRLNIPINFLHWDAVSSELKSPAVVVYLGSEAAKNDDRCKSQIELQTAILEILGILEKERQVFISYRRNDATNIAVQLFHALTERRFKVFLDQFQINPSENIQDQIAESLEDMAFVLLLQSPDLHNSKWVDVEITHVLKSQIPVVVVRWSNITIDLPKISRANLPTITFDPTTDMVGNAIQQFKVAEILQRVCSLYSRKCVRTGRHTQLERLGELPGSY